MSDPFIASNIDEVAPLILQNPSAPKMILVGEKATEDLETYISSWGALDIPFIGGLFPGVLVDARHSETDILVYHLPEGTTFFGVHALDQLPIQLPDTLHVEMAKTYQTALVWIDGLSPHIASFLSSLYNLFGSEIDYLGGGAGSLSLSPQPCVFSHEGFFQDTAVIAMIPMPIKLGVRHGWQKLKGPLIATKTSGNVVEQLNWGNAFEVYRGVIEEDGQALLGEHNFFDIAKGYPFGLYKENAEDVVRDPIRVDAEGKLICVGEVGEHAVLNILRGQPHHLIQAASKAAGDCELRAEEKGKHMLIIDCISRVLFLEKDFSKELHVISDSQTVRQAGIHASGALTLGEISSYGEGLVEFFNKTIVLGVFYERH
ncbi:MAG: FIST C-terminal domain-containing protein [Bacteroidota bacterium]